MQDRRSILFSGLALDRLGLEIAPYFNPIARRERGINVHYTDYIDNDEIKAKAAANPTVVGAEVPLIDFVWRPESDLKVCAPENVRYGYAIASHVLEHVPDTVGWLNQVLSVLDEGARIALILPDRRRTMDFFRRETTPADLVEAWLRRLSRPTPGQIFDYLSRAVDDQGPAGERPFEVGTPFETARRHYTDHDALKFAMHAWSFAQYFDVHCTVWTPSSFVHAMVVSAQIGLLNIDVLDPIEQENEFLIHLVKRGEPKVIHPGAEGSVKP